MHVCVRVYLCVLVSMLKFQLKDSVFTILGEPSGIGNFKSFLLKTGKTNLALRSMCFQRS